MLNYARHEEIQIHFGAGCYREIINSGVLTITPFHFTPHLRACKLTLGFAAAVYVVSHTFLPDATFLISLDFIQSVDFLSEGVRSFFISVLDSDC